jgi:hypothetical protein
MMEIQPAAADGGWVDESAGVAPKAGWP